MARKLGLRTRSAMLVLAALATGGTAAGIAASQLPDLSTTSLASLRTQDSPALSAAMGHLLADGATKAHFYREGE